MNYTTPYALIFFCVMAEASYQLCFKSAADGASLSAALRKRITWVGIGLWALEIIAWVHVLQYTTLTTAFPLMALVYVAVMLGSMIFLKESPTMRHGLGAVLIAAGVACVASGGA